MDFTNVLDLIIKLAVALVVAFLVPWIRRQCSAEQLTDIMTYVGIFVRAAEQLFAASDGEKKKKYVLERLAEKGIRIDSSALEAMIEAAVNELHQALVQPRMVSGYGDGQ